MTGAVVLKPDSECNMPCKGDPTVMCGGPARLSVYTKDMRNLKRSGPGSDAFDSTGLLKERVDSGHRARRSQDLASFSRHRRRVVHGLNRLTV